MAVIPAYVGMTLKSDSPSAFTACVSLSNADVIATNARDCLDLSRSDDANPQPSRARNELLIRPERPGYLADPSRVERSAEKFLQDLLTLLTVPVHLVQQ